MKGLGRVAHFDARNQRFRIRALTAPAPVPITSRYWNDSALWLDQGPTSQCTAYSLVHYMADGPVTHRGANPIAPPASVYRLIQSIDREEGRDYGADGGGTMLAQSKAALSLGWYGEYRWGYTLDELVRAVLTIGPVLVGSNWYEGQMDTDATGRIHVRGSVVGGHAYVINGVNTVKETARVKNSWSRAWGVNGHATISFPDLKRLIAEDGEVVLAREMAKPQAPAEGSRNT